MITPTSRLEKVAGLILVVALVMWGANLMTRARIQAWFHPRPTVTFVLDEAHGLTAGMAARMSGVAVGTIRSLGLTGDNEVLVTVDILEEHRERLRQGLRARVVPPALFGSPQLALVPGTDPARLADGARIPVEVATGPIRTIESAARRIAAAADNIDAIAASVRAGEGTLGALMSDDARAYANLQALMAEGTTLVREFRMLGAEGTALVRELRRVGDEAVGGAIAIREVAVRVDLEVQRVGELLGRASQVLARLDTAVRDLVNLEARVPGLVDDTRATLAEVRAAMQKLSEEIPETAQSARRTTSEAQRLIRAAERNFMIRGNLEPVPAPDTSASGTRRWDPYGK